ncbi:MULTISPECIES: hypothetical protein [Ralstonia]|jgi:hypothetical protein|uniref:Uncharacterized protein n=2 Tax=Ralstonia pickettii TaxID=329 RepID=R0CNF9_RALPI|nr:MULTISPECIES: hypothetical protein [Ralstonia]ENZ78020.1 hypothetical protein OR214_02296 [Ralstonia pickettii OR214]MCM3581893.1 hypothetical protein [Ralstonia pickettii]
MKDTGTSLQDLGYTAEQVQAIKRQYTAAQIQGIMRLANFRRQPVGVAMGFVTTLPISKGDPSDRGI